MHDVGGGFIVAAAVVCEGFRAEEGGKVLLYGIYTGDIIFQEFPGEFPLAAYVEFSEMPRGGHQFRFEYRMNGVPVWSLEMTAQVMNSLSGAMPLLAMPVRFVAPGTLTLNVQINGGEMQEINRKRVIGPQ